jgi:hypothetical protein
MTPLEIDSASSIGVINLPRADRLVFEFLERKRSIAARRLRNVIAIEEE